MRAALRENIFQALDTIRAHKMRSTLVILGVAIGVTTLMAMVTILTGLSQSINASISSSDNVVVNLQKFDFLGGNLDPGEIQSRPELEPADWYMIRNTIESVRLVDYQQQPQGGRLYLAHYRDRRTSPLSVAGMSPDFQHVYLIPLAVGRFFTLDELERNKRVCVLGKGPLEDLFPDVDPIGKRVRVRGEVYEVVGAFEGRKSVFGGMLDNFLVVPFTTYRKDFARSSDITQISMVPKPGYSVDEVMGEVRGLMRGRHKLRPGQKDDFALVPADRIQSFIEDMTAPIGLVLTVIASIGLMVGGIGVMAIMLVSVTERTREIGIRKAVGATRAAILGQFLTEAVTLTGIGGLAGMLAGLAIAQVFSMVTGLPSAISWVWMAISISVSVSVGLIFGMYPAAQAARLDPVDAIRHE